MTPTKEVVKLSLNKNHPIQVSKVAVLDDLGYIITIWSVHQRMPPTKEVVKLSLNKNHPI